MMNYIDFTESVEAARRGETEAFEYLYNQSVQVFRASIYPMLKNEYDIEDVLQEAYIAIFKNLSSLEDPRAFIGWGKTICRNVALHHIRTAQRHWAQDDFRPPISDDEYEGMDTLSVADERGDYADPQEQLDAAETKRLLDEMIGDLPEMQRLCIVLWQEGLTTAEIAERLAIPKGTVNSNVNYAKKKIKDKVLLLEKQGTKLYGLAPIPFFLWLMRQFESQGIAALPAAGNAASFSSVMRKLGSGKTVARGTAAAKLGVVKIGAIVIGSAAVIGGARFAIASGMDGSTKGAETAVVEEALPEEEIPEEETAEEEIVEEETPEEEVPEEETVEETVEETPEEEIASEADNTEWIQEIYDAFLAGDFDFVRATILDENFLTSCEPYEKEDWAWWDYETAYRLPLEGGGCIGVVVDRDSEDLSRVGYISVFIGGSDGAEGFDALGYGDYELALSFSEDGTVSSEYYSDGTRTWNSSGYDEPLNPGDFYCIWHV